MCGKLALLTRSYILQLKVLKDSHVYSRAEKHATSSFVLSNADRTLILYIVWGMNPNDMSDCHFSTPKCRGKRDWDSAFDPSTPEAQIAIKVIPLTFAFIRKNRIHCRIDLAYCIIDKFPTAFAFIN